MASTSMALACTASAMVSSLYPTTNYSAPSVEWGYSIPQNIVDSRLLLLSFDLFPTAYKYNRIYGAYINLSVDRSLTSSRSATGPRRLSDSFSESSVTWNTRPAVVDEDTYYSTVPSGSGAQTIQMDETTASNAEAGARFARTQNFYLGLQNPITQQSGRTDSVTAYLRTATSENRPVLVIVYDDTSKVSHIIQARNSPTSGYVNPRTETTFSWTYGRPSAQFCAAENVTQTRCTLFWRTGTSGAFNQIGVSNNSRTLTVPANTFPIGGTVQWYLQGERDDGFVMVSSWYTFSTAAASMVSTPTSPKDSIESNDSPIVFRWDSSSDDGNPQTIVDLQYSANGGAWSTFETIYGEATETEIPADTFPSGPIAWRVRGYNVDGSSGPWSDPVSFIAFGAPDTPSVTARAGAFALISWQAPVQEAYRITVDGVTRGPFFGKDRSFQVSDPLSVGPHVVTVEVQNSFGLWSKPGTVEFDVEASAYAPPTIQSPLFEIDATLPWQIYNAASTSELLVYRDGVKIARLDFSAGSGVFVDRFVLGRHRYQLVQRVNTYYAAFSEEVAGTMTVDCSPRIALLSGGAWQTLRLSDSSSRSEDFSFSQSVSLRHFSGADWPVAEIGPQTDGSGSFTVSFPDLESAQRFEALRGQAVIVKSRGENVTIGVLSNLDKTVMKHYIRYWFTLNRIFWRDFVDRAQN